MSETENPEVPPTVPPTAPPGCAQCRAGAYGASWPPPRRVAINGDGPTYLHRCDVCGTFWGFDMRAASPVTEARARRLYPAHFADWSQPGGATPPEVVSGGDFSPADPLFLRNAPPEGALERALAAVQAGAEPAALLGPLLRTARLQTPSTTLPAPDGSGMTPIALDRPPVVWVMAFTRLGLARRFADDAPHCLGFSGPDLLARLPAAFGLFLNYGAESACRLGPQDVRRLRDLTGIH